MFYEVGVSKNFERIMYKFNSFFPAMWIIDKYAPKLILPVDIFNYANIGVDKKTEPFIFKYEQNNYQKYDLYIDNDRVGFKINK